MSAALDAPLAPADMLAELDRCMVADRHALTRGLSGHATKDALSADKLGRLEQRFRRSRTRFDERAARVPVPSYDDVLPVSAKRADIAAAIRDHQVVVVCGETGSGKTTQLPKILLELGRGVSGAIGHTQPRRIAARTVASRVAEELKTALGDLVGYQVRFVDQTNPNTLIKMMTDGVLLAELARDRYLNAYDTIVVDEAHERSLNIDFILGYLRQLLPRRPDMKVVITSATIDPERFAKHFHDAPVIEVSGRGYPVDVQYRPLNEDGEQDINHAIGAAVSEAIRSGPGDILVFLPGEREIRDAANHLRHLNLDQLDVLPFYARLGLTQQTRIFQQSGTRRVVLATNVAETSVTVPGIRYVVDTGLARVSRYSYRTKVQGLPVEKISQASAEQRKGRCGRIAPGVCFRLYPEDDHESREPYTDAEILRTNLAAVILQMKALRLGPIEKFPFLDKPDPRFVKDGYRLLRELGALTPDDRLTATGKKLARLPLDPRLGRMLLAAVDHNAVAETLTIAAALSVADPRERPLEHRELADEAHRSFADKRSDFVTWLNLWAAYQKEAGERSRSQLRAWCKTNFLSPLRMREWADIRRQLKSIAAEVGASVTTTPASYEQLHQALLHGLLSQVGRRHEESGFKGTRGSRFHLFPGSGVKTPGPKWVMTGSLVQTRRLYAHGVAGVQPEWIERVAGDQVSRRYHEPRWDARRGEVIANEQVTYLGLVLSANRRVQYARVNALDARAIFIQEGLVDGQVQKRPPFLEANLELIEEVRELERKLRRADLLVERDWLHEFYNNLLPMSVVSMRTLDKWLRRASREERDGLVLTRAQLLTVKEVDDEAWAFPASLQFGEHELPLAYGFAPGAPADGVTVRVPVAILNQLDPHVGEWIVPGLLHDKVLHLLRSLPKRIRRSLVPLPDFARACVEALTRASRPLAAALTERLQQMTGMEIPADAWRVETVPTHLILRYEVVDDDGDVVGVSRDLAALKREHGLNSADSFGALVGAEGQVSNLRDWSFGELPERAEYVLGGVPISGYPAIIDEGESVGIRVLQDGVAAREAHQAGVRRLVRIKGGRDLRNMPKRVPKLENMALVYATCVPPDPDYCDARATDAARRELEDDLLDCALNICCGPADDVRDEASFKACAQQTLTTVGAQLNEVAGMVAATMDRYHAYQRLRDRVDGPGRVDGLRDTDAQLARLLHRRFVLFTDPQQLKHLPRYVDAAMQRLERMDRDARQDTARLADVLSVERLVWQRLKSVGRHWRRNADLVALRWMVEELRVSVFAQQLKTPYPVSVKRVQKALHALSEKERLA